MKIKNLVAGFLGIAVLAGVGYGGYTWYQHPDIGIEKDTITVEYGSKEFDANRLIGKNVVTTGATMKNIFEDYEDKIIPVGEYTVPVFFRDTTETFVVSVEDTTAPKLSVDVNALSKSYDNGYVTENTFLEYSEASDLSEYDLYVNMPENFDNTVPGDYTCTVEAMDKYGNTSSETVNFSIKDPAKDSGNTISIDSIGVSSAKIGVGDDQDAVNQYDVLLMSQFSTPGHGEPILMAGHNTRSFADLSKVKIGDTITVNWDGTVYKYKVTVSEVVTTTGADLSSKETGENMIEYSGREVLQMYTCYKIYADNERWMIKAEPIE